MLFPGESVLWKTRKGKDGKGHVAAAASDDNRKVRTSLHVDLDRMLACTKLDTAGESLGRLTHWCGRVPQRNGHTGRSALQWCCSCEQDARDKVATVLTDWSNRTSWAVAADNRWTAQPITQKKVLVAELCGQHLTRGLRKCRVLHQLDSPSIVTRLSALLQEDKNNWAAKNKMRLQNICINLCGVDGEGADLSRNLALELARMVTIGSLTEQVLYALLGRKGDRERCTLGDLLCPSTSPVLESQENC